MAVFALAAFMGAEFLRRTSQENASETPPEAVVAQAERAPVRIDHEASAVASDAADFARAVQGDAAWLAGVQTRVVGRPEHDAAVAHLKAELMAIPGLRVWTHGFEVVVPVTEEAALIVDHDLHTERHAVYPMWPAGSRLNTTPREGIAGALFYAGMGKLSAFPSHSLQGQIAVLELAAGDRWHNAAAFGAAALLFLGSPKDSYVTARKQDVWHPLGGPRFFVPDGPLADALRTGQVASARIAAKTRWERRTATNLYALLEPGPQARGKQALVVAAQFDAMSVVPDLAPGADAAVDAALLLNLLREFAGDAAQGNAPAQPVMGAFLDAQALHMRGMRRMLGALAVTQEDYAPVHERDEARLEECAARLDMAKAIEDDRQTYARLHGREFEDVRRCIEDEVNLRVMDLDEKLRPLRLEALHAPEAQSGHLTQRVEDLSVRRARLHAAMAVMSRGKKTPQNQTPEITALCEEVLNAALRRIEGEYAAVQARIDRAASRARMRREMADMLTLPPGDQSPIRFVFGIELSDAGISAGPNLNGAFWRNHWDIAGAGIFLDWLDHYYAAEKEDLEAAGLETALNMTPRETAYAQSSYFFGHYAMLTTMVTAFGVPSISWATLSGCRARVDTPYDHPDALRWDRLTPQIGVTRHLLRRLINDPDFAPKPAAAPKWSSLEARIVSQGTGDPVARLPRPDYLTSINLGGANSSGRYSPATWVGPMCGVRRSEYTFSDPGGYAYFDDLAYGGSRFGHTFYLHAVKLDAAGRAASANDLRAQGARSAIALSKRAEGPLRGIVFPCASMQAFSCCDPRFLTNMKSLSFLDARQRRTPQRLNYCMVDSTVSGWAGEDVHWQLIMRNGVTANRMLLVNAGGTGAAGPAASEAAYAGFPMDAPLPSHPVHIAARDMHAIDQRRLAVYRRAGIGSQAIAGLHNRTARLLEDANVAAQRDDGGAAFYAAALALASEVRAYEAVRSLGNDVIRAAVFLLLLLIPFSAALERLIFASPRIGRQVAGALGIFGVMAAALWAFHPAFRIGGQPIVVLLAFAMMAMSLLVIAMILSRFKAMIEEYKGGLAESSGMRKPQAGLWATAAKLGIANMRKRKLRTLLTGATVVLLTFAILCFFSTNVYRGLSSRPYNTDHVAHAPGVLLHQPNYSPMEERTLDYLDNMLRETGGEGWEPASMASRYWFLDEWYATLRVFLQHPADGSQVGLKAALGLTGAEADVTGIDAILDRWDEFAQREKAYPAGRPAGIYVAASVAERLGLDAGSTAIFIGQEVEILDTFEPSTVEQRLRDVNGESLFPLNYAAMGNEELARVFRAGVDTAQLAEAMQTGEGMHSHQVFSRMDPQDVVIVPASMIRGQLLCHLRSIAIPTGSAASAESLARLCVEQFAYPAYYGAPGKTCQVVAARPLVAQSPRSLVILVVLAGLIVFNTMMNSLSERKREIYVYTSLGLAPLHVGILFLAEAATYGLLGAVLGYVIGQGAAGGMHALGWAGGLTLNYSGTHAIIAMGIVMAIVVGSALLPAYLAGRLAMPSNRMTWEVPQPQDGVICDLLPFTVNPRAAGGVFLYLEDFFKAHREGVSGTFTTKEARLTTDAHGYARIDAAVWLAPYDLGVSQHIRISLSPVSGQEDELQAQIELRPLTGAPASWIRLNKAFLSETRRRLLGWRGLSPERIGAYLHRAQSGGAN